MIKYPRRQLLTASTTAKPTPTPIGRETWDTPLPDAPATAPIETDGWKTVERKAIQRKKKNAEADKTRAKENNVKPPTIKNGGWGKKPHQPMNNNTPPKRTRADIIKAGGINVQIVLGNGYLGLTTPRKMRGERQGGAAHRLGKKDGARERGAIGRGKDSPEMTPSGGNTGGKTGKNGRGREQDREEPSLVASVQAGHMDKTM
jgi:hypothetical protein